MLEVLAIKQSSLTPGRRGMEQETNQTKQKNPSELHSCMYGNLTHDKDNRKNEMNYLHMRE